jgi:hypothetical protein
MRRRAFILRGDQPEPGEKIGVKPAPAAAAGEGIGVHPGIDQRQGNAARAVATTAPGQMSCSAQTDSAGRQ